MLKKIFFIIVSILLIFTTTVYSAVLCPPSNAIHCKSGICIVDPPYSNDWRLFVTRHPNDSNFLAVSIDRIPGTAICQYGYDTRRSPGFFTLHSLKNYSPDLKAPANQWIKRDQERYDCWENTEVCPMNGV